MGCVLPASLGKTFRQCTITKLKVGRYLSDKDGDGRLLTKKANDPAASQLRKISSGIAHVADCGPKPHSALLDGTDCRRTSRKDPIVL